MLGTSAIQYLSFYLCVDKDEKEKLRIIQARMGLRLISIHKNMLDLQILYKIDHRLIT